ncbi:MAG: Signal peptidase I [Candidatus Shapirobacteria bacterium GW2011_GWE1_38_10]|uniref:Signal peptidase I n=1 Tax=Candidatus Shapirobacteria bacterium GW2011_GWE1_38_10 TaxID=1618488 RepID=A0A0G0KIM6_9BACT|nr:MAG: Signal peptidase I [Candidatus Shapirobacteria bacterium GW2011_GWF2_37_20]KKQ49059.1 MAG: Signal peptidase I [Candidatus Shapirobacteria bacterium GW2011_GWE1_38_10]KKQ65246.1 MAG: Signal peptidase I [Candidatus Shapirobacteria bacterium GW2011_GWF1_38_23]HBP51178.1 signal peptidase I [Candidatus Shapirobacteria bacterium]
MKFRKAFSLGNFILEFVQSIVLALSVFVLLYLFVAQPNQVKGSSMVPNFTDGEYLLTDKLSYQFSQPMRGDVVVFKAPATEACAEDECEYIKRIIGLPGDRVMVENNKVYLNGQLLEQNFLPDDYVTLPGEFCQEGLEVSVPEGQFLVFGDNRSHSRDSREFGPINKELILGKAFFKYWPISAMGLIPTIRL